MATRKLKHSYTEQRRSRSDKEMRSQLRRMERRRIRQVLNQAVQDPQSVDTQPEYQPDGSYMGPNRAHRSQVLKRWLDKQVGRPWDQVYSTLVHELGRPLTQDSVCWMVCKITDVRAGHRGSKYLIDQQGIFRKN